MVGHALAAGVEREADPAMRVTIPEEGVEGTPSARNAHHVDQEYRSRLGSNDTCDLADGRAL
jgi:hypothetical protein